MYTIRNRKGEGVAIRGSSIVITNVSSNFHKYENLVKANNVIKCMPRIYKDYGLRVYNESTGEFCGALPKQLQGKSENDVVQDIIGDIEKNLAKLNEHQITLTKRLSEADLKVTDVQHYIENNSFNASDGYKLCKLLQQILQERRGIKNSLRSIQRINKLKNCNISEEEYEYKPRILKELFQGKIDVKNVI